MAFGAVIELAIGFFFPDFANAGAGRKLNDHNLNERNSDDWFMPRIIGLVVFFSILISGLWFSYLHP